MAPGASPTTPPPPPGQPAPAIAPPLPPPALPQIRLQGQPIHQVTQAEAIDHVMASLAAGVGGWVLTPNLDIHRRLCRDSSFSDLCQGATLRLADGMPLIWASRLRATPLPERVAGSDLMVPLATRAAREGRSVFLLGGNPGAADGAAAKLLEQSPDLRIAGTECPPFGFEGDEIYLERVRARLLGASPDIIFVGLGSPKQERLIRDLRELLPRAWFLGVGITLSFVAGEVRRAPVWMRRCGLEWSHRLIQEPRRLGRRYLVDGGPAAGMLLMASVRDRLTRDR
jgi:N-acetylglucosaminyldiphosphoundecaprenol N-acetyl-beta-D-mannosaminyltransferase